MKKLIGFSLLAVLSLSASPVFAASKTLAEYDQLICPRLRPESVS